MPAHIGARRAMNLGAFSLGAGGGGLTRRLLGQGRAFGDGLAGRKSDGTVNSFNTDEGYYTPVDIPNPAPIYAGFVIAAAGSVDVPNVVQYHTVLYPQGGGVPIDFVGGLFDVASGTVIAKPAPKAGVTIPAGFHRVRTFGKVPSGGFFYYTGRFRTNASTGHGVGEVGVDLADKAAGGTISSQAINLPMTFLGFEGDAPTGHRTIAVAGDSNSEGIGYGATPRGIGGGILAAHLEPRPVSYVQIGRSGAGPIAMRNGYAKIAAFLGAIGATDWWCHAGTNDYYGSNVNATSEKAVMKQLLDIVLAANPGIKTWWATMPPIASIAGSPMPATSSNQSRLNSGTAGGYDTDDRRLVVNDWLRAGGLVGLTGYTEHALPVQRSDDPYKWTDDSSRDGLHYYNTGVSMSGGGAVLAALASTNPLGLPAAA